MAHAHARVTHRFARVGIIDGVRAAADEKV